MRIRVELDTRAALRFAAGVLRQIPYAVPQALNDTIRAAQRDIQSGIPRRFTVRSPASQRFLARMVKIPRGGFATRDRLMAELRIEGPDTVTGRKDRTKILARHELGGTFAPRLNPFFIPSDYLRAGDRPIPRSLYPSALGIALRQGIAERGTGRKSTALLGGQAKGKRRTFAIGPMFGHDLAWGGIYQREGRGASSETQLLWLIHPQPIRIPPRLEFRQDFAAAVRREWPLAMRQRLEAALRGARVR